jgi:hypothetical protein
LGVKKTKLFWGLLQVKFSLMKTIFSLLILLFAASSIGFAQAASSSATSSVSDSTLYVVDGKVLAGAALQQIPFAKIASVNVVKKDTLVNGVRYKDRIYVLLKKEEEH